jgi:hypothetical protein
VKMPRPEITESAAGNHRMWRKGQSAP